jgi:hypothetical protein
MIRQIKYLGVPGCDFTLLAHARVNNHAKIAVKGRAGRQRAALK